MSNAKETKVEDHDYSLQPVPQFARRRLLTMFMIMLGFTFFSASMWTGQTLGDSLDLSGFRVSCRISLPPDTPLEEARICRGYPNETLDSGIV